MNNTYNENGIAIFNTSPGVNHSLLPYNIAANGDAAGVTNARYRQRIVMDAMAGAAAEEIPISKANAPQIGIITEPQTKLFAKFVKTNEKITKMQPVAQILRSPNNGFKIPIIIGLIPVASEVSADDNINATATSKITPQSTCLLATALKLSTGLPSIRKMQHTATKTIVIP